MSTPKPLPLVVPAWLTERELQNFAERTQFRGIEQGDFPARIVRLTSSGGIPEELVERVARARYNAISLDGSDIWSGASARDRKAWIDGIRETLTAALTPDAPQ